jgi:NAD(P)-dependent dehydrogenase (short-subunit alcohol dehydrogenase family)
VADTVANAHGTGAEDIASRAASDAALGRFTEPQEVADLIVFMAADLAANITGSDHIIDGGLIQTL